MRTSESIKVISVSLLKAQLEMGNAVKGTTNPFFKSRYSDLNAVREAALPVLNKFGITVLQPTTVIDGKNYVETTLLHESGEFLTAFTEIVCSKPNDPQAHGSGLSYSRRYGLQSFLCIGSEDDDAESNMDRQPSKPAKTYKKEESTNAAKETAISPVPTQAAAKPTADRPSFRRPTKTTTSATLTAEVSSGHGNDI